RKGPLWIVLVCLFLWVLYGGSSGFLGGGAQSPDWMRAIQTPRMIRTSAGQPDATGWVPVLSAAGGFSASVPGRFNEAIAALKIGGRRTPVVIVGVKTEDLEFVAIAAKWTGGSQDLKTRVKTAVRSLCRFKNPVVVKEELFDGKFPLIEMEGDAPAAKGLARIIATDRAVYGLTVEGPALTDDMRADARRFFESFATTAPEPNEAVIRDLIDGADPNQ
ncbi:MAG: hypothetical protein ACM3VT_07120, partial [Solirubrobacterales bacterium]